MKLQDLENIYKLDKTGKKDNIIGKYVDVKIKECNSATLFGEIC